MRESWLDYMREDLAQTGFLAPDWSAIEFEGEDWREWLQGQTTSDLRQPTAEHHFCMCKPTGQILTFGTLVENARGGATMIVPRATVPDIMARVDQMVIMEDLVATPTELSVAFQRDRLCLASNQEPISEESAELYRLTIGFPDWQKDIQTKTLPPELGPKFEAKFINYNKGCYTGQEVLQRIHSRGHTNREWGVLRSQKPEIEAVGFEQTSQAEHPGGFWLVAGYLRREADLPEGVERHEP